MQTRTYLRGKGYEFRRITKKMRADLVLLELTNPASLRALKNLPCASPLAVYVLVVEKRRFTRNELTKISQLTVAFNEL